MAGMSYRGVEPTPPVRKPPKGKPRVIYPGGGNVPPKYEGDEPTYWYPGMPFPKDRPGLFLMGAATGGQPIPRGQPIPGTGKVSGGIGLFRDAVSPAPKSTPSGAGVSTGQNVFQRAMTDIAGQTRDVNIPEHGLPSTLHDLWMGSLTPQQKQSYLGTQEGLSKAEERPSFIPAGQALAEGFRQETPGQISYPAPPKPGKEALYQAALKSYETQADVVKQETARDTEALEIQRAGTENYLQRLGEIRAEAYKSRERSRDVWAVTAGKAEEYVQSAELRTQRALDRLDEINDSIGEDRDFAKAHAMNAAAQAVIGSMKELEDQTIQKYGVGSKEHQQFQVRKAQTLSTTQSQIQASYQQLAEQQGITYMNANNELQWKEDMYASFQEQQHVETLRYLAQANDTYDMQLTQLDLVVAQAEGTVVENWANWVGTSPVRSMDLMPLMTYVTDLLVA